MKVKAIGRGICIGVDQSTEVGKIYLLDAATAQYLISINAAEPYTDPPEAAVQQEEPPVQKTAEQVEQERLEAERVEAERKAAENKEPDKKRK